MNKKYLKVALMGAMVAVSTAMFFACGDDDKDGNKVNLTQWAKTYPVRTRVSFGDSYVTGGEGCPNLEGSSRNFSSFPVTLSSDGKLTAVITTTAAGAKLKIDFTLSDITDPYNGVALYFKFVTPTVHLVDALDNDKEITSFPVVIAGSGGDYHGYGYINQDGLYFTINSSAKVTQVPYVTDETIQIEFAGDSVKFPCD
ncbi:hypothetical protein FACS1894195_1060 [Bacteroidia bacterium]|nr:hypothetical protein FACS1894195_1060 [Bacteroidia bacterium]